MRSWRETPAYGTPPSSATARCWGCRTAGMATPTVACRACSCWGRPSSGCSTTTATRCLPVLRVCSMFANKPHVLSEDLTLGTRCGPHQQAPCELLTSCRANCLSQDLQIDSSWHGHACSCARHSFATQFHASWQRVSCEVTSDSEGLVGCRAQGRGRRWP